MTTLYKLTRPDLTTYGGYQWALGEERTFPGQGELCGPGWCHAYLTPELAVLLNPIHAAFASFRLFRAEGVIGVRDGDFKVGCSRFRLCEEMAVPVLMPSQQAAFAVWCGQAVHRDPAWNKWAENWLTGKDRSANAAARAAARAAANAAAYAAAYAANAAAYAAYSAYSAYPAARAAHAAAYAAHAAAYAARAGTAELNLRAIGRHALVFA